MRNYFEEVKEDVKRWIEDNMDLESNILNGEYTEIDEIAEYLNDTLWTEDSVTGNGSGSYTFNSEEAKENVLSDMDTVQEALKEFCVDAATIGEKFLDQDWEYLDVTARCYVLGEAIGAVLFEIEDDLNALFEEAEKEEV